MSNQGGLVGGNFVSGEIFWKFQGGLSSGAFCVQVILLVRDARFLLLACCCFVADGPGFFRGCISS